MNDEDDAKLAALIDLTQSALDTLSALKLSLESMRIAPPQGAHRLAVKWLSQLGPSASYAPGDCGAACLAMLVNYHGGHVTVDDVSKATGKKPGYGTLAFNELITAAAQYGITLQHGSPTVEQMREDVGNNRPVIALVNYRSLPHYDRYSASYNAGHYLLIVGYDDQHMIYHDSYWPQHDRGEFRYLTVADFTRAYTTVAPGNTLAQHALRMT